MDESELIRRARDGDRVAYEDLLRPLVGPAAARPRDRAAHGTTAAPAGSQVRVVAP